MRISRCTSDAEKDSNAPHGQPPATTVENSSMLNGPLESPPSAQLGLCSQRGSSEALTGPRQREHKQHPPRLGYPPFRKRCLFESSFEEFFSQGFAICCCSLLSCRSCSTSYRNRFAQWPCCHCTQTYQNKLFPVGLCEACITSITIARNCFRRMNYVMFSERRVWRWGF